MSLETAARPDAPATEIVPDRALSPLPAHWRSLPRALVYSARSRANTQAIADSTKEELTYGQALLRAVAIGRVLAREVGPSPYVGVMIPPTANGALVNLGLSLFGKVPVNLNYTAGQGLVDAAIDRCGITHTITARKAVERFKITPKGQLVHLEDLPKKLTTFDKVWAAAVARAVPIPLLGAFLPGLRGDNRNATATIIFTSGSTGQPKGVVLSHGNVLSNIHAINQQVQLQPEEVVLGILPFFHGFGFTIGIWTVLCLGKKAVYHFNPLDARIVGNLSEEHKATVLFGSPTFMAHYLKKCDRSQFAHIRLLVLGAEKLKPELATAIRGTLGIEPLEGYGCTELSPVVAVNVPQEMPTPDGRMVHGNKLGTVGLPLPGTAIKTTDPETGEELPRGSEGLVHVKGPQVMVGYFQQPELTAKVLKDGWYLTGDLGFQDADGFLTITGRESRFSKIGGEMVPHERVESAIAEIVGGDEHKAVVVSLPDARRGERLVVVHTDLGMTPVEVCRRLNEGSLPKLWLPSAEDFVQVEAIPVVGIKVAFKEAERIARSRLGD